MFTSNEAAVKVEVKIYIVWKYSTVPDSYIES